VVLIAFTATGGTANANYISNCERGNARTALKEVLVRWERRDDIIKGILG
jgi:t-SNARE complex subunit (syntaxin)